MKGFVPTPDNVVDLMVAKLFEACPPKPESTILDPGCGTGAFIQGILRWCRCHRVTVPHIVGIESDAKHVMEARATAGTHNTVRILEEDFLLPRQGQFDYIIGNPPYVPITKLSEVERGEYRKHYRGALGRFDLYLLFFEQALRLLKPSGRLVFITPEKFLYVQTAKTLRRELTRMAVEEIHFLDEGTFGHLVTYPTITTIRKSGMQEGTRAILRDWRVRRVQLPDDGSSWMPFISGFDSEPSLVTLGGICRRISCGVATGADSVFVTSTKHLPQDLRRFAFPTIAGREIRPGGNLAALQSMLVPYGDSGELLPEEQLGELGSYLREPSRQAKLLSRTCVARKPWYAFHENPPLAEIRSPKILCKDITQRPFFLVDQTGEFVPRHSVYYLVPNEPSRLLDLCEDRKSVV